MDANSRVKKVLSKVLIVEDDLILDSALPVEDLGVSSLDRSEPLIRAPDALSGVRLA
jgi:acyl carrier protein